MDTPETSAAPGAVRVPVGCSAHLRPYYERLVNSFPAAWLKDPATSEEVANLAEGERRLRAFAVAKGFDVGRTGGGSSKVPACLFKCIHHGFKTANKRGLDGRVVRDGEGKIISRHRRETSGSSDWLYLGCENAGFYCPTKSRQN